MSSKGRCTSCSKVAIEQRRRRRRAPATAMHIGKQSIDGDQTRDSEWPLGGKATAAGGDIGDVEIAIERGAIALLQGGWQGGSIRSLSRMR